MKSAIVLVCIFAFTNAADIDWTKVYNRDGSPFLSQSKRNSSVQPRIIGGQEATPHQFPHQAGLIIDNSDGKKYFCGGSMISKYYVLTAAHCCEDANSILVIMGAHYILEYESTQRRYNVPQEHIEIKEDYDSVNIVNDICLLYIEEGIEENPGVIESIELPHFSDRNNNYAWLASVTVGWGRTNDIPGSSISPVLKFANSFVLPNLVCGLRYTVVTTIKESQICMDSTLKSTCNGDSGGPLIVSRYGKNVVVGITSFGIIFCSITQPSAFTRVTSFLDWIDEKTQHTIVKP